MTGEETLEALWQRLNDNMTDDELFDLLLIMSDAEEEFGGENGDNSAKVLRWAAKYKKRPWFDKEVEGYVIVEGHKWHWFPETGWENQDPESNLPDEVFSFMEGGIQHGGTPYIRNCYKSRYEAYDHLFDALECLVPECKPEYAIQMEEELK